MNQYHVTVTSDGVYSAIRTDHCQSVQEIDEICNHENWFGCDAENELDAINQAKSKKFSYVPKKKIAELMAKANNLAARNKEFLLS